MDDWTRVLKHDLKRKAPTLEKWSNSALSRRNPGQYGRGVEIKAYDCVHLVLNTAQKPSLDVVEKVLHKLIVTQTDIERNLVTPLVPWYIDLAITPTITQGEVIRLKHRSSSLLIAEEVLNKCHLDGSVENASNHNSFTNADELVGHLFSNVRKCNAVLFLESESVDSYIQSQVFYDKYKSKRVWVLVEKSDNCIEIS